MGWFGYNVLFGQYHESDISFGTSFQIRLFFIVKYFMIPTLENYMPPPSRLIVTLPIKTKGKKKKE